MEDASLLRPGPGSSHSDTSIVPHRSQHTQSYQPAPAWLPAPGVWAGNGHRFCAALALEPEQPQSSLTPSSCSFPFPRCPFLFRSCLVLRVALWPQRSYFRRSWPTSTELFPVCRVFAKDFHVIFIISQASRMLASLIVTRRMIVLGVHFFPNFRFDLLDIRTRQWSPLFHWNVLYGLALTREVPWIDAVSRIFAVSSKETLNRLIQPGSKEILLGKQDFIWAYLSVERPFSSWSACRKTDEDLWLFIPVLTTRVVWGGKWDQKAWLQSWDFGVPVCETGLKSPYIKGVVFFRSL